MQQISVPLRVALGAILLLAAVWFVALRPKGAEEAPSAVTPPGVEGLSNSVAQARNAKEAADAAAARSEQAASGADESASSGTASAKKASGKAGTVTVTKSSKSAGAKPPTGAAARRDARRLVAALNRGQAVVLLFRNGSADSAHVARVVRGLDRRRGRVVTRVTSIGQVGNYAVFTSKTKVSQAPTTFVIGNKRRTQLIVGYTSTTEVDQAVGDVLGTGSGRDRYGKGRGRARSSR